MAADPANLAGAARAACGDLIWSAPHNVVSDEVDTYELGWKADLLDDTLRFNGVFYRTDIKDLQNSAAIVANNVLDAEVSGFKGDFLWRPSALQGLTVDGGVNLLKTEIIQVNWADPQDDTPPVGDPLPYAPEHQGNIRARYEWRNGDVTNFIMPQLTWSAEYFVDMTNANRYELEGWELINFTTGVVADEWVLEFYINNVADQAAQLAGEAIYEPLRVVYAQPRTIGVRFAYDF